MPDVARATDQDLAITLQWLEVEYHKDGGNGFWCNRRVIERSHQEFDDLYVIREEGIPVSFQVGSYAPVIVSTRKDVRGKGYASMHLGAALDRARRDDVNVLEIECSPRASWKFWQRRGFERYGDMSEWGEITARMILTKEFDLPVDCPRVPVRVDFYPEEVKYRENIPPLYGWTLDSALLPDDSIQLPRRILGLSDDVPGGDMVVRVEVDGREVYRDKGKYVGAQAVGIRHDLQGGCFFVDRVLPIPKS